MTARAAILTCDPRAAGLAATSHNSQPPNRARTRRTPPGLAQGSPREGVRQPEAGSRGRRSPAEEATGRLDAHLLGRDPAGPGCSARRSLRAKGACIMPVPRIKGDRERRVPMCWRALEVLKEARALGRDSSPVFASARKDNRELGAVVAAQGVEDRGGASRFPLVVPRLGDKRDESSTRGRRGGAGPQGPRRSNGWASWNGLHTNGFNSSSFGGSST